MTPERLAEVRARQDSRRRQAEAAHVHAISLGPSHLWSAMQDLEDALAHVDAMAEVIRARDAEVAAKALREAAEEVYGDDRAAGPYSHPLSGASWLRDRADRIDPTRGEASG